MSRIDEIAALVAAGEPVDDEKFTTLLALDCAKAGEVFVDEMLGDMKAGQVRYGNVKRYQRDASGVTVEFFPPEAMANGRD